MNEAVQESLAEAATDQAHFRGLTFSGRKDGGRVSARVALVRGQLSVIVVESRDPHETTRTVAWQDWPSIVRELLEDAYTFLHVRCDNGDWHVKVTRKGHVLMSRGKAVAAAPAPATHDREKAHALTPANSGEFLRSLDVLDEQGRIRPSMQAKYRQINGFLNRLEPVLPDAPPEGPYVILDCGCGSAHLSFAVFHYLNKVRGWPVLLTGIDRNAELMGKNRAWQERLGWNGLSFVAEDLSDYAPSGPVDLVLSLHACDTATDLALARGAAWRAKAIISAPCCQHELHRQLQAKPFQALLRHGILRERMADLVTDALRAAALRLAGYSVKVVEFASSADTGRNLLIRAERTAKALEPETVAEYRDLKAFWAVEPEIERLLRPLFPERFPG